MTIIERICSLLEERGMKKKTLCEAVGLSPSTLSTWIAANIDGIPSQYIPGIAALFGMTCDELLTGRTSIVADEDEAQLLRLYRALEWDGRQMVLAAAIAEQRRADDPHAPEPAPAL